MKPSRTLKGVEQSMSESVSVYAFVKIEGWNKQYLLWSSLRIVTYFTPVLPEPISMYSNYTRTFWLVWCRSGQKERWTSSPPVVERKCKHAHKHNNMSLDKVRQWKRLVISASVDLWPRWPLLPLRAMAESRGCRTISLSGIQSWPSCSLHKSSRNVRFSEREHACPSFWSWYRRCSWSFGFLDLFWEWFYGEEASRG